jgi:LemA protein
MDLIVPLILIGVAVLIVIALPIAWYNKLVRLRQLIKESWGNVDVQLKRRYDLIPNLVNVVKGYAKHEQETLQRVIEARNKAVASTGAVGQQSADEQNLVSATKGLFAVIEKYPDLKASGNFLALQTELVNTEDRIAAARRFYNANVRDYNITRTSFPTMLAAKFGDFPPADFFEVEDHTIRAAPAVSFAQS